VEICHKTPNNFHKNKKIQMFCIIACPKSITTSKSMTVGKLLKFASKPEQPSLSSSIRLEVV
jgi:hypothetical protein